MKQHITNHPELWKWDKSPDRLLQYWFECQNDKNTALLQVIENQRKNGTPCYVATEQEKYRTDYIKNVMFDGDVDGVFSTADIGFKKNDTRYYEFIIKTLSLEPGEITFFDDSQSKVDAAKLVGINAQLYTGVDQVESVISRK